MLIASEPQRLQFLSKYGYLAQNPRPGNPTPEPQTDVDASQWIDVTHLLATEDRHDGEWLVVDASKL